MVIGGTLKTAVLGGGLTGLTLAYLLGEQGVDVEVLEKETECGGLMRSLRRDGFTFDYGGSHILFSKNELALDFLVGLLGENKVQRSRNTKVLYKDCYVKYPFENGLADLPKQDNFECLYSFIENLLAKEQGKIPKPTNLYQWFYYTFGSGIADKYLVPYNEKIWKHPLDDLTLAWVERVPNPPVADIVKSSLGIQTEGYTHQSNFYYPVEGGIEAVIKELEKKIKGKITLNYEVKSLHKEGAVWVVSDGKKQRIFDKVISSLPIQDLVAAMDAPKKVREAVDNLQYNSLIAVMLGLDNEKINDFSWLYLPDKAYLSHRVSFPSNYSLKVAPKGKSSVLAEVTCKQDSEIWKMNDNEIAKRVISDLHDQRIIDRDKICFCAVKRSKYAYVLNDSGYEDNLAIAKKFVRDAGVDLLGRFSEYAYLNMDACVEHALAYVKNCTANS